MKDCMNFDHKYSDFQLLRDWVYPPFLLPDMHDLMMKFYFHIPITI